MINQNCVCIDGEVWNGNELVWCSKCDGSGKLPTEKRFIQTKNPITKRYVKIDVIDGHIVSHKRTKGPYKGIPIGRKVTT